MTKRVHVFRVARRFSARNVLICALLGVLCPVSESNADGVLESATARLSLVTSVSGHDSKVSIFIQRGVKVIAEEEDVDIPADSKSYGVSLRVQQPAGTSEELSQGGMVTLRVNGQAPDDLMVSLELEMVFSEKQGDQDQKTSSKKTVTWVDRTTTAEGTTLRGSW